MIDDLKKEAELKKELAKKDNTLNEGQKKLVDDHVEKKLVEANVQVPKKTE